MLYNKQTLENLELVKKYVEMNLNTRLIRSVYEESEMRFLLFFDYDDYTKLNFWDDESKREVLLNAMTPVNNVPRDYNLLTKKDSLLFELLREEEILKRKLDTFYSFREGRANYNVITDYQLRSIMWAIKAQGLLFKYEKKLYEIKRIEAVYNVSELEEPIIAGTSDIWQVGNNTIHTVRLVLEDNYSINISREEDDTDSLFIKLSKNLVYKNI